LTRKILRGSFLLAIAQVARYFLVTKYRYVIFGGGQSDCITSINGVLLTIFKVFRLVCTTEDLEEETQHNIGFLPLGLMLWRTLLQDVLRRPS